MHCGSPPLLLPNMHCLLTGKALVLAITFQILLLHGPAPSLPSQLRIITSSTLPLAHTSDTSLWVVLLAFLLPSYFLTASLSWKVLSKMTVYASLTPPVLSIVFTQSWCSTRVEWMLGCPRQFITKHTVSETPQHSLHTSKHQERTPFPLS